MCFLTNAKRMWYVFEHFGAVDFIEGGVPEWRSFTVTSQQMTSGFVCLTLCEFQNAFGKIQPEQLSVLEILHDIAGTATDFENPVFRLGIQELHNRSDPRSLDASDWEDALRVIIMRAVPLGHPLIPRG